MKMVDGVKFYDAREERLNIITHASGIALSIIAFILLIKQANSYGNNLHQLSYGIFGGSLMLLYSASTLYHSAQNISLRKKFRILDHISIYVLIAGTYTPFALHVLKGNAGWKIFIAIWSLAFIGMILKIFFTGKYNILSTMTYVGMSWIILFAIKPLIQNFSFGGLAWLFGGGLFYTLGAFIYSRRNFSFNHAIFHVMVLGGSSCHFIAVYFFIIPAP